MKWRVRFEYDVTVPDHGTSEYEELVQELFEEGGLEEAVLPEDPNERIVYIADSLAYYLVEKSHVGDHTEKVELVYDAIESEE